MDQVMCLADDRHRAKERAKARTLRASQWWKQQLAMGQCYYCGGRFPKEHLTMDHKIPIARGGKSTRGNVVVSCKSCNDRKSYLTPADLALDGLKSSKSSLFRDS